MGKITVIVKEGHYLSDNDFWVLHATYPHETEYLELKGFAFEDNILYLN
tara:strand:- start:428 stop:574 length:147 start_codon:yes stop_codon:yes gene_type:complete